MEDYGGEWLVPVESAYFAHDSFAFVRVVDQMDVHVTGGSPFLIDNARLWVIDVVSHDWIGSAGWDLMEMFCLMFL